MLMLPIEMGWLWIFAFITLKTQELWFLAHWACCASLLKDASSWKKIPISAAVETAAKVGYKTNWMISLECFIGKLLLLFP
jgi:penicillin-binding protein-related factor A (putative recombinase)